MASGSGGAHPDLCAGRAVFPTAVDARDDHMNAVLDVYNMWCQWLDAGSDHDPRAAAKLLAQGGENLRSFVQFIARTTEPHSSAVTSEGEPTDDAIRRSLLATGLACQTFPGIGPNCCVAGQHVLGVVCNELLQGLQAKTQGCSVQICIILQYLLASHDLEVCSVLLQCHAPFVLLRALDQPGCAELLLGLLLGVSIPLPLMVPGYHPPPISTATLQQVVLYLATTKWPQRIDRIMLSRLQQEGTTTSAKSCAGRPLSPPRSPAGRQGCFRSDSKSPGGWHSPGWVLRTPHGSWWGGLRHASSLESSPVVAPASPVISQAPPFPSLPASCTAETVRCAVEPHGEVLLTPRERSKQRRAPSSASPPGASSPERKRASCNDSGRGICIMIEFLACLLETCGRTAEAFQRPNQIHDEEMKMRVQVQLRILEMIFIDTQMISNLFGLLRLQEAQFETATLLHALLQDTLNPNRVIGALSDRMLTAFLQHTDQIGSILQGVSGNDGETERRPAIKHRSSHELRLNSYTVRNPLGALRVVAVQILAALCDLAPDDALPLITKNIWALLAKWFLTHRCNHIFQAACSRILVTVIKFGKPQLQQLIFKQLHLLGDMCDIVLSEGDRWHDVHYQSSGSTEVGGARMEKAQVTIRRRGHPGGLGSIVPVLSELEAQARASAWVQPQSVQSAGRQPLGERTVPQQQVPSKPVAEDICKILPAPPSQHPPPCYIVSLLDATSVWARTLDVLNMSRQPPKSRIETYSPRQVNEIWR